MGGTRKTLREWLTIRNVVDFPPLWTLAAIGCGVLLHSIIPVSIQFPMIVNIGIIICMMSFSLMIWCAATLYFSKTPMLPHNDAESLVTHGPYRWSRNPIYLADLILVASSALMFQTLWPILFVPVLYVILRIRFVIPEEEMLKVHFPEAFRVWSENTRRWI